jgi:membrane-associated phospholipid phosphatase
MAATPLAESRNRDRFAIPGLRARSGGPAEKLADRLRGRHPAAVFSAALAIGLAALMAVSVALGLLVKEVLLDAGLARPDERVVESIVAERSATLTDASDVGSMIGGAPVLPILAALVALVCAWMRKWRLAAFAVFVLAAESATYRVTSLVVPRERPDVKRLEDLPADASYPSGHTAAAIAVYAGLVLLITSRYKSGPLRVLAWTTAVAIPVVVALSRMYRGMHHPLDVAGGMVVGIGAVLVLLFACRAAGCAEAARGAVPAKSARSARSTRARTA